MNKQFKVVFYFKSKIGSLAYVEYNDNKQILIEQVKKASQKPNYDNCTWYIFNSKLNRYVMY